MFGNTMGRTEATVPYSQSISVIKSLKDNTKGLSTTATDTTITDSDRLSRSIDTIDTKRLLDL